MELCSISSSSASSSASSSEPATATPLSTTGIHSMEEKHESAAPSVTSLTPPLSLEAPLSTPVSSGKAVLRMRKQTQQKKKKLLCKRPRIVYEEDSRGVVQIQLAEKRRKFAHGRPRCNGRFVSKAEVQLVQLSARKSESVKTKTKTKTKHAR
jgi:hypothetical protein